MYAHITYSLSHWIHEAKIGFNWIFPALSFLLGHRRHAGSPWGFMWLFMHGVFGMGVKKQSGQALTKEPDQSD